ncbi:hypothetical protein BDQ17DRAFT_1337157 [Cyathus striatus]|nr:hypothetical protein BDQ17DRAFT_1337157 [Cyathus striatus]
MPFPFKCTHTSTTGGLLFNELCVEQQSSSELVGWSILVGQLVTMDYYYMNITKKFEIATLELPYLNLPTKRNGHPNMSNILTTYLLVDDISTVSPVHIEGYCGECLPSIFGQQQAVVNSINTMNTLGKCKHMKKGDHSAATSSKLSEKQPLEHLIEGYRIDADDYLGSELCTLCKNIDDFAQGTHHQAELHQPLLHLAQICGSNNNRRHITVANNSQYLFRTNKKKEAACNREAGLTGYQHFPETLSINRDMSSQAIVLENYIQCNLNFGSHRGLGKMSVTS